MGLKSYAYSFLKWMLALAFVFAIYMFIQVVVAGFGGTVIGVIAAMASGSESFMEGAALDNAILMLGVAAQLVVIAVFLPWWRCMRPASFVARREAVATNDVSFAKSLALLLVIGVSAQFFVGGILEIVELLFPEAMAEYSEFMEDTSVGVFAIVSALSIAVLAPINEEIVCRGVMFEHAMRAMSPGWNAIDGARYRAVSVRAFWIANTLQALAFGVLHMNFIQGSYAFVLGAVLGWVFWRTGKLCYPIILHFALNISSYLVEPLYPLLSVVPTGLVIVLAAVMCAAGIREFGRLWSSSDALGAIERPQDVAAVQGILPVEGEVGDRPTPTDGYLG
ncbi:MAG: CPBP family intramembrane metalloprotease [Collinsella intestinalis]|nr:CPBP family intramembrane metalloprotease [Collinsella intestinalis]